jgi:hypothetical protein
VSILSQAAHRGPQERIKQIAPAALVGLGVFLLVGWFNGRRMVFSADRDEGYSLIKTLLVRRGHPLYSETWSDQPPGYTWLLSGWTWLFGDAPEVARLSTALLLACFAFACFELCRRTSPGLAGYAGGTVCVLALLLQKEMFRFGCATMISLPAVLCMGLGWAVSAWSTSRVAQVMAGLLLAFSLAIKPLGLPALPGILLGILISTLVATRDKRQALFAAGRSAGACLLGCGCFYWPVFLREGGYTVYQTNRLNRVAHWPGLHQVLQFFEEDAWLFAAALLGLVVLGLRRRVEAVALGLWLVLGALILALYHPVWTHHRYLLLIPAAVLVGLSLAVALEWAGERGPGRRRAIAAVVALGGFLVVLFPAGRLGEVRAAFRQKSAGEHPVVQLIRDGAPQAQRMVTSHQTYAYRLGLDIPPSQSVTSRKRFGRWGLSSDELVSVALAFDPDVVALDTRWPQSALIGIRDALRKTHALVYKTQDEFVLVRKTMMNRKLRHDAQRLHRAPTERSRRK